MKKYLKPEVQTVVFETEVIANTGTTTTSGNDGVVGGGDW